VDAATLASNVVAAQEFVWMQLAPVRRPSPLTREALEEVVGLLASYGEYVEVEVAIEHVRSLSRFALPEPAEVQHLWDPEGNSMCGGGGTFDEAPDLGDRLIDIPVCAKCFIEIRREQRDSRWGSEPAEVDHRTREVTAEMVERAAKAINIEGWTYLGAHEPGEYCDDCRKVCLPLARAALTAALGGGES